MNPEGFTPEMESIAAEEIDPRGGYTSEQREGQDARHEREGSLSGYIHEYWKGDAHAHSTESTRPEFGYVEGVYNFDEMAAYYEKLGLEFAAITEHSSLPTKPEIQSPDSTVSRSLLKEVEDITNYNRERGGDFALLSGVEANIMFDESGKAQLDLPREVTGELDLVIASRHGIAREKDLGAIEASLQAAIEHPDVDVIGHPDRYLMNKYDWDFLRKNDPEAQAFHQEVNAVQKEQRETADETEKAKIEEKLQAMYHTLRQGIGQDAVTPEELAADPRLTEWLKHSEELHAEYNEMWDRLLAKMAERGKAFEVNLTSQPDPGLVERAAKAGVKFFVNFDAHDFAKLNPKAAEAYATAKPSAERWAKGELSPEDAETLQQYKAERLASGPGVKPILRMARWLKRIESYGVTPDRVVNSSRDRLLGFLRDERGKHTANLEQLHGRSA
jgi:histidinol phosphatase-like PHP family hydrolase